MVKKEIQREALTKTELDHVTKRVFSIDRLNQVRDFFVFSCYTGLAYADVKNLSQNQLVTGIDGEKWIVMNRQKTITPMRLPLLPQALEIVLRLEHHPSVEITRKVLPAPSNQKMNAYLKDIADPIMNKL